MPDEQPAPRFRPHLRRRRHGKGREDATRFLLCAAEILVCTRRAQPPQKSAPQENCCATDMGETKPDTSWCVEADHPMRPQDAIKNYKWNRLLWRLDLCPSCINACLSIEIGSIKHFLFETIPPIWFSLPISDDPRFGRAPAAPALIPTDEGASHAHKLEDRCSIQNSAVRHSRSSSGQLPQGSTNPRRRSLSNCSER